MINKVNISEKFSLFNETWTPKVVAQMNQVQFKLVKVEGEFVWHTHEDTDEVFIVIEGNLGIEFRHGTLSLAAGEMCVIPKGEEHKPFADKECKVMIIEPCNVVNTGDSGGALTAENDVWI